MRLTDGTVVLAPMTLDDVDAHLAGEDEAWVRFTSGGVGTAETASRWISANLESWASGGPMRCYGIWECTSGALCGTAEANLALSDTRDGVATISYALHPWARGRGYATRAVLLIVDDLATTGLADTAMIQIDPDNTPSLKVPERAGFRPVGERLTVHGGRMVTFVRRLNGRRVE